MLHLPNTCSKLNSLQRRNTLGWTSCLVEQRKILILPEPWICSLLGSFHFSQMEISLTLHEFPITTCLINAICFLPQKSGKESIRASPSSFYPLTNLNDPRSRPPRIVLTIQFIFMWVSLHSYRNLLKLLTPFGLS